MSALFHWCEALHEALAADLYRVGKGKSKLTVSVHGCNPGHSSLEQSSLLSLPLLTRSETCAEQAKERATLTIAKLHQKLGDFPLLGPQSPPGSPQRRRTGGGHIIGGVGLVPPLQDFTTHSLNGVPVEAYRGRSHGSTSSNSSVFVDSPLAQADDVFRNLAPSGSQSERISAMEEQIASLAGLVHRALSVGAEIPDIQDFSSENGPHSLLQHKTVSRVAAPTSLSNSALKHRLALAQQSVSDLRLQLDQLRHQQLCQQASVQSMLRTLGQELLGFMRQKLLQNHEAFVGPRAEVERGRREYVSSQERILSQLSVTDTKVNPTGYQCGSWGIKSLPQYKNQQTHWAKGSVPFGSMSLSVERRAGDPGSTPAQDTCNIIPAPELTRCERTDFTQLRVKPPPEMKPALFNTRMCLQEGSHNVTVQIYNYDEKNYS
ncbi:hypothetical protein WMY93_000119 [Mugilogobius chulae]|uniref:Uncharacterized protein n=1 Tax=Mugilogobius chulae TaxID=88201 RepID=A0AAW0PYH3_9GOBI